METRREKMEARYRRHRVSTCPEENDKLSPEVRFNHLEHDIILNTDILSELVAQNDKYSDYLDTLIKREKDYD